MRNHSIYKFDYRLKFITWNQSQMLVNAVINIQKENRDEICAELNGMINVLLVSESKEQACIESLFDAVVEVIEKILSK